MLREGLLERVDRNTRDGQGTIARIWGVIAQPSKRFALGTLIVAGAILGVLFWAASIGR